MWQSIQTAPTDGVELDLWVVYSRGEFAEVKEEHGGRVTDAFWKEGVGWVETIKDGDYAGALDAIECNFEFKKHGVPTGEWSKAVATHWMPRPLPPRPADHPQTANKGSE